MMNLEPIFHSYLAITGLLITCWASHGCSGGSVGDGSQGGKSKNSVSKSGESQDNESVQADLPAEIAGGYLTCSYVSTGESGFAPLDTHMPVGCAAKLADSTITDKRYTYRLELHDKHKNRLSLPTKIAHDGSKWHQFGHLQRADNQDLDLVMTVKDLDTGIEHGPLFYAVRDLKADGLALFELAGGFVSSTSHDREGTNGEKSVYAEAGITPESFCSNGQRRVEADLSQETGVAAMPGVTEIFKGIDSILPTNLQKNFKINHVPTRTKEVRELCVLKTKLRDRANSRFWPPVSLPGSDRYVQEGGGGCLFITYFDRKGTWNVLIYDRKDQRESGIVKEHLEAYVRELIDQRKAGKIKVECPP